MHDGLSEAVSGAPLTFLTLPYSGEGTVQPCPCYEAGFTLILVDSSRGRKRIFRAR